MSEGVWMERFTRGKELWFHDGNPKRPHALLASGLHSDGFFNASLIIEDPEMLEGVCADLASIFREKEPDVEMDVARVAGPAMGAITLAYELARQLGVRTAFTEPVPDPDKLGGTVMTLKRFALLQGEEVIAAEDVLTTGGSTEKNIQALEKAGAVVLPVILAICNRSGKPVLGERRIIALVDRHMTNWKPEECPLCKLGSQAVRPKANWAELTAKY